MSLKWWIFTLWWLSLTKRNNQRMCSDFKQRKVKAWLSDWKTWGGHLHSALLSRMGFSSSGLTVCVAGLTWVLFHITNSWCVFMLTITVVNTIEYITDTDITININNSDTHGQHYCDNRTSSSRDFKWLWLKPYYVFVVQLLIGIIILLPNQLVLCVRTSFSDIFSRF